MFLSLLSKKETLKFIDLAIYMINIDGSANEVEQALLSVLLLEVEGVKEEYTFEKSQTIEETLAFFDNANYVVKNIVFLNLVKITMEDDLYNTEEHLFLEAIEKRFDISIEKRQELMSIVFDERDLREKASRIIKTY